MTIHQNEATKPIYDIEQSWGHNELIYQLKGLVNFVGQSLQNGTAVHKVEKGVWLRLLKLGHQLLTVFFESCGDGDIGSEVVLDNGRRLSRLPEHHSREYGSIFGEFRLSRVAYGTREGQKIEHVPLDARLQLPESKFSYLLQDWDQSLAVESPYAQVDKTIARILGLKQSVNSIERTNGKLSSSVNDFLESRPASPPIKSGEFVVATSDCKGVCIRGTDEEQAATNEKSDKKKKGGYKKMAVVGSVYTVMPYIRNPEAILKALFREPESKKEDQPPRPRPSNKQVRVSLLRDENDSMAPALAEIFGWLAQESASRSIDHSSPLILLMDGQDSLWKSGLEYFPETERDVIEILDIIHVSSHVWDAVNALYPKHDDLTQVRVKRYMDAILNSNVDEVIESLYSAMDAVSLTAKKFKKVAGACGYLRNNRHRMYYREYLEMGYPIASGVIEGACRHVVKDRMERSGMRWTMDGAHAMLSLRCIQINDFWDDFMSYHAQQEAQRLYPHRVCDAEADDKIIDEAA